MAYALQVEEEVQKDLAIELASIAAATSRKMPTMPEATPV